MATKTSSSPRKTAAKGGNGMLLALAGGAAALYFLSQSSSDTPNYSGGGANYDNSPMSPSTPGSLPTSTPSSLPSSLPKTGGSAGAPLLDKYGVPHLSASTVAQGNAMDGSKGLTYKTMSDTFGLYFSEVDALMEYDYTVSGDHTYQQVYDWYAADPSKFRSWMNYYNSHNPNRAPIQPRGGQ